MCPGHDKHIVSSPVFVTTSCPVAPITLVWVIIMSASDANGEIVVGMAPKENTGKRVQQLPSAHSDGPHASARPNQTPFLIGVAGGTASGKSTVCRKIMEKLGQQPLDEYPGRVVCISQESFYRQLDQREREEALKGNYNFDHPDALDSELIIAILSDILEGREVRIPCYDFTQMATSESKRVHPADVVLVEGILVFYYPQIRDLFHMRLFVDTDPDTRLARRVLRDVRERGRDLEFVLTQYTTFVKPAFEDFCLPTKKYADVIIPRGADNEVAIDLIVQNIGDYLSSKEFVIPRPTTPGSGIPTTRSRMYSGSGSFSTIYGSSPPPARPH